MTIREMQNALTERFAKITDKAEAQAMAKTLIMDVKGYKALDLALYPDRTLLPETEQRMLRIADKVIGGMPLQYAIGAAYFHGRNFKVTPSTLIPRPETSELIDIIVDQNRDKQDLQVLDIGTGTGCIAISLALDLPFSHVTAIDISEGALSVAQENATTLRAKVDFKLADALRLNLPGSYNIIVSNPPYVMMSEKGSMDSRVVDYEPSTALFVPDNDPLLFYKAIAQYGQKALAANGRLYFEINPLAADSLKHMLQQEGYKDVDLLRDYKGNIRFAICHL